MRFVATTSVVIAALMGTAEPPARASSAVTGAGTRGAASLGAADIGRPDPLRTLQRNEEMLQAVLRHRVPAWSPEADAVGQRVDALLSDMLDYDRIARNALGPDWERLTAAQRRAFMERFSALTNRAFTGTLGRADLRLRFDSEIVIGSTASVVVTALGPGSVETTFDYRMTLDHGRWLVCDVLADRDSLVDGYRVELGRLIRRGGFDELIARMDRKLGSNNPP
jgi:phospholipid transport system substrate-binding protein